MAPSVYVMRATGSIFTDDFNRANGAVGNGWTVRTLASGSPAISSGVVVGGTVTNGSGDALAEVVRDVTFTPQYVEVRRGRPGTLSGTYLHLFAGSSIGGSIIAWTGVSFSQGASGDYRIWKWVAGSATQMALGSGSEFTGLMRLTKSGNVYTGSLGGSAAASWNDSGATASWGTMTGFLLGSPSTIQLSGDDFTAVG